MRAFLDARGVAYRVTPGMVRGLDYYERTAWEWVIPGGGAQAGTISGGGRYDGLAEQIGGDRVPGVGFGCGIERVVLALEDAGRRGRRRTAVDWFCAMRGRGRPAGAARAARSARARAGSRVRPISPDAASRASCATPSGCARASSRSAAPATASVASSGTERARSRSAISSTTWSGACATQ